MKGQAMRKPPELGNSDYFEIFTFLHRMWGI